MSNYVPFTLTARRPFKSAARPADQRGPSTFACPSSRASFHCASSGALRLRDGKAVSQLHLLLSALLRNVLIVRATRPPQGDLAG